MQVGDLVRWAGKKLLSNEPEDIGIIVAVGNDTRTNPPYCRVHWFDDNQEYNYVLGDHDIQLLKKV